MDDRRDRPVTNRTGGASDRTFAPVALSNERPAVERWLTIVVIGLVIAVAKPWTWADAATSEGNGGPVHGLSSVPSRPTASATIKPDSAGPAVAAFCLDPGGWRVASIELWRDQTIRVWRAFEPATMASGPDDPKIPIVGLVSEGVTELGWCAPAVGNDRPRRSAAVEVWRRSETKATPIRLVRSQPEVGDSAFGALYRPPALASRADVDDVGTEPVTTASLRPPRLRSWIDGTYVFRYRETRGWERWFAIQVELRASTWTEP